MSYIDMLTDTDRQPDRRTGGKSSNFLSCSFSPMTIHYFIIRVHFKTLALSDDCKHFSGKYLWCSERQKHLVCFNIASFLRLPFVHNLNLQLSLR